MSAGNFSTLIQDDFNLAGLTVDDFLDIIDGVRQPPLYNDYYADKPEGDGVSIQGCALALNGYSLGWGSGSFIWFGDPQIHGSSAAITLDQIEWENLELPDWSKGRGGRDDAGWEPGVSCQVAFNGVGPLGNQGWPNSLVTVSIQQDETISSAAKIRIWQTGSQLLLNTPTQEEYFGDFDPVAHRFMRLSCSGGHFTFEVSADRSSWTTLAEFDYTVDEWYSTGQVGLAVGSNWLSTLSGIGWWRIDNLNMSGPPGCGTPTGDVEFVDGMTFGDRWICGDVFEDGFLLGDVWELAGCHITPIWESRSLNVLVQERLATLSLITLRAFAQDATSLIVMLTGDGGLTFDEIKTVALAKGDSQISIGANVTGSDVRIRLVFPTDFVVRVRDIIPTLVARGPQEYAGTFAGTTDSTEQVVAVAGAGVSGGEESGSAPIGYPEALDDASWLTPPGDFSALALVIHHSPEPYEAIEPWLKKVGGSWAVRDQLAVVGTQQEIPLGPLDANSEYEWASRYTLNGKYADGYEGATPDDWTAATADDSRATVANGKSFTTTNIHRNIDDIVWARKDATTHQHTLYFDRGTPDVGTQIQRSEWSGSAWGAWADCPEATAASPWPWDTLPDTAVVEMPNTVTGLVRYRMRACDGVGGYGAWSLSLESWCGPPQALGNDFPGFIDYVGVQWIVSQAPECIAIPIYNDDPYRGPVEDPNYCTMSVQGKVYGIGTDIHFEKYNGATWNEVYTDSSAGIVEYQYIESVGVTSQWRMRQSVTTAGVTDYSDYSSVATITAIPGRTS